jgi:hypothetical protein
MKKYILIIILFIGILFVAVELAKEDKECPPNKVIYRFIPRTLDEELETPEYVSDVFRTMFSQPSPWIKSIDSMMLRKRENINQFFISQV